jgi:hypothetical protein
MVQKGEGLPRGWSRDRINLLHRRIRKVTIVSNGNAAGHCQLNRARVYPDARGSFNESSYKIFADMFALYAGELAQKRFAPRSLRTHHVSTGSTQGHADNDQIVDLALRASDT